MKVCLFFLFSALVHITFGQKPSINPLNFTWTSPPHHYKISEDGSYVLFQHADSLVIKTFKGGTVKAIKGGTDASFLMGGKSVIYKMPKDSIVVWSFSSGKTKYIGNANAYSLIARNNDELLIFNERDTIHIVNVYSGKRVHYLGSHEYLINKQGTILATIVNNSDVLWIDLQAGTIKRIFQGKNPRGIKFDQEGFRLTFFAGQSENCIYLYQMGTGEAKVIANNEMIGNDKYFHISSEKLDFSSDGTRVFFYVIKKKPDYGKLEGIASLNIWSYKDDYLQSAQQRGKGVPKDKFLAVTAESQRKIYILEDENDKPIYQNEVNRYLVFESIPKPDAYYNPSHWPSLYLIDCENGSRITVSNKSYSQHIGCQLSPDEKFIIWFDKLSLNYICYEIASKTMRVIAAAIPTPLHDTAELKTKRLFNYGIAGWIKDDTAVLIYDQFDIWKVDPRNMLKPINITKNFGRVHRISFGLIKIRDRKRLLPNSQVLFSGYSAESKMNGIFTGNCTLAAEPKGTMHPYNICIARTGRGGIAYYSSGVTPIKAMRKEKYLFVLEHAEEAPNLFTTTDFDKINRITNIQPQEKYNWLTADLLRYTLKDGNESQGILYKPENFDSTKKYPLIFNFYEKRSDQLYTFLRPDLTSHNINIPTFVSNDYLVFVPDVYSQSRYRGEGTYNSVVSAAEHLSKFSWVDSTRMAIQGHSYGGFQTNYLVARSNIFAAACEFAGTSNSISSYNYLSGLDGEHRGAHFETGAQGAAWGVGVTPWTDPDAYIRESAVFFIDKVTTPLLMVHCRKDQQVPFDQAIEFFTGLKRAQKKVWFLEYDNSDHQLVYSEDSKDFTVRLFQFFDHYLKGKPAPIWMTQGVPAYKKGAMTGFEYDSTGVEP